jgi:hypothetical protein
VGRRDDVTLRPLQPSPAGNTLFLLIFLGELDAMRKVCIKSTIALFILFFGVAQSTQATSKPFANPNLGFWMNAYWTWALGGDQADRIGNTIFMPLPEGVPISEDCPTILVGELDVTLKVGEQFVMPMFAFVGETYLEDIPDDNPDDIPQELFTSATVVLKMDGKVVLDSSVKDLDRFFFDATYFDEPIFYGEPTEYGSIGAIWVKGIGFIYPPLPPGQHKMELFVDTGLDLIGSGGICTLQFINTWNITVEKPHR